MSQLQYTAIGAVAVLGLGIGLGLGWAVWGQRGQREGPAPAVRNADASVVLERKPEAAPTPPKHQIPKGGREERRVSVTIQPAEPCPPVTADLSLVRFNDGSARVVASSPDGEVVGGLDVPLPRPYSAIDRAPPKWAAGLTYAGDRAWGVLLHRDLWRFRVGLEINATRGADAEARLLAAWTW